MWGYVQANVIHIHMHMSELALTYYHEICKMVTSYTYIFGSLPSTECRRALRDDWSSCGIVTVFVLQSHAE
jgi:hypothetical protein